MESGLKEEFDGGGGGQEDGGDLEEPLRDVFEQEDAGQGSGCHGGEHVHIGQQGGGGQQSEGGQKRDLDPVDDKEKPGGGADKFVFVQIH